MGKIEVNEIQIGELQQILDSKFQAGWNLKPHLGFSESSGWI